ncbi:hypothetical protein IWQ61_009149 [Dispira simplex]|nr:hypothetical protein IWQ61_009149 [Dispira simplex]
MAPDKLTSKKRSRTAQETISTESNGHKIKVICRVRPFLKHEPQDESVLASGRTMKIVNQRNPSEVFMYHFDACYSATATQPDIFQRDVRPIVDNIFQGLDATIFCYGVTGAGKTYTIQGSDKDPGIIPRTVEYLFANKRMRRKLRYSITCSYFEIYKEAVFDLLVPRDTMSAAGLPIREDGNRNVFVANLTEKTVMSYAEFQTMYRQACKNRSTASTKLNVASSRSHAVLTLQLEWRNEAKDTTLRGRVHLIDLAGSEDNRRTENGKDRMAESGAINKSLFVLGQVVEALNSGAHRIPYRDSKMTRILQQSLGGRSLGMMIVNIAPGQRFYSETYNTLNFATKSKQIVNKAEVNEFQSHTGLVEPKRGLVGLGKAHRPDSIGTHSTNKRTHQEALTDSTDFNVGSKPDRVRKRPRTSLESESNASGPNRRLNRNTSTTTTDPSRLLPPGRRPLARSNSRSHPVPNQRRNLAEFEAELESKVEEIMEKKVRELKHKVLDQSPKGNATSSLDPGIQQRLAMLEKKLASQATSEAVMDLLSPTTKHKNAHAYVKHGKMLEKQGKVEEALVHFERAVEYVPDRAALLRYIQQLKKKHGVTTLTDALGSDTPLMQQTGDHSKLFTTTQWEAGHKENTHGKSSQHRRPLLAKLMAAAEDDLPRPTVTTTDPQPSSVGSKMDPAAHRYSNHERPSVVGKPARKNPPKCPNSSKSSNNPPAGLYLTPTSVSSLTDSDVIQCHSSTTPAEASWVDPMKNGLVNSSDVSKNRRGESQVLALINSTDLKTIMSLKGIGKKRAVQIQEFVQSQGPLETLSELAFIGFKDNLIKKLVE